MSDGAETVNEGRRGAVVDAPSAPADPGRPSALSTAGPRRNAAIVNLSNRRLRWAARHAVVELATAGIEAVEHERRAAAAIIELAGAGDADGLAEILRPDPDAGAVIWTVACYQIGDLTPTALRDLADPVDAVALAVACPEASHIAAELVASTPVGLRWTALVRAGEVVRFHLPGDRSGNAASDEEKGVSADARARWQERLADWSAELEPTAPVPIIDGSVLRGVAPGRPPEPVEHPAGPRASLRHGDGFARTALAAAAALAEGAGIEFDPSGFTAHRAPPIPPSPASPPSAPPSAPPVDTPPASANLPAVATCAEATPVADALPGPGDPPASMALEVVAVRHGAEIAAVETRHAAAMDAALIRHSAEMAATATRHQAELDAAFRRGREQALADMQPTRTEDPSAFEGAMMRLSACLEIVEQRLRDVEAAVRAVELPPATVTARSPTPSPLPALARRLATTAVAAASDGHPRVVRLVTAARRWMASGGAGVTDPTGRAGATRSDRPASDTAPGRPIETNSTPA